MKLENLVLKHGSHSGPSEGACLMEAVSLMAGEPWSDHPACASPVLAAFGRTWNDGMRSDQERAQLLQYVPRLVGTANGAETERARSFMALDWLVRVHTPVFLDLVPALRPHATALRNLSPIVNLTTAKAAGRVVRAAWDAARDAARTPAGDAARDAARTAAWDAAGDAARTAAGDAAWDAAWAAAGDAARAAAGDAAWDAAKTAAGDAAWDAARAAAGDAARAAARTAARAAAGDAARTAARTAAWAAAWGALEPTVITLQASAHGLFDRMIHAGGTTVE